MTHTIAKRLDRFLKRQGLLERDVENSYLTSLAVEDKYGPMHQLHGSSVTYRIAVGPRQGRKVSTLLHLSVLVGLTKNIDEMTQFICW